MLLHPRSQVQWQSGHRHRSGGQAGGGHLLELGRGVRESRDDRRDEDTGGYPGVVEPADRLHPLTRMGRARLGELPDRRIQSPDGEIAAHLGASRGGDQTVEVAQDQGGLGQDGERVPHLRQGVDDAAGQVVLPLRPLIRVGVRPHGDDVPGPPGGADLGADALDGVDLDHERPLEVLAYPESQVLVGGTGEAVRAGVTATPVGVDGVPKGDGRRLRHGGDDALGPDMEELEAAVGADADVAVDEFLLGEQRRLATVVVGQSPAEFGGPAHGHSVANVCSIDAQATVIPELVYIESEIRC